LLCRDDKRLLFATGRRYLTDIVTAKVDLHLLSEITRYHHHSSPFQRCFDLNARWQKVIQHPPKRPIATTKENFPLAPKSSSTSLLSLSESVASLRAGLG
jgi:hypothetical protein